MSSRSNGQGSDENPDIIWRDDIDAQIESLANVFNPAKLRQLFVRYHEDEDVRNAIDQACVYHSESQRRAARERARSVRSNPPPQFSPSTGSEIRLRTQQARPSNDTSRVAPTTRSRRNRNRVIENNDDDQDGDGVGTKASANRKYPRKPTGLSDAKRYDNTPFGRNRRATGPISRLLDGAIKSIRFHVFTESFNPDGDDTSSYAELIPNPMDLETMQRKMDLLQYHSVDQFMRDVYLIVDNCISFYGPQHEDSVKVKELRSHFEDGLIGYEEDN